MPHSNDKIMGEKNTKKNSIYVKTTYLCQKNGRKMYMGDSTHLSLTNNNGEKK
jgi:hypothetical protein